ncbi:UNVERIFIED_CONTAM: hypothetical protein PYX00_008143 [Menopon gallinae]|uniref:Uncharacterized protein n=1 Tax=Menopon gallinae TaxID=328185 RepID=A0AAW2HM53_9NEOP
MCKIMSNNYDCEAEFSVNRRNDIPVNVRTLTAVKPFHVLLPKFEVRNGRDLSKVDWKRFDESIHQIGDQECQMQ